jgi:hypothetical protein
MLHLAQVIKSKNSEKLKLHLLAVEESKMQWTFCHEKYLLVEENNDLKEEIFLLVELDENNQIIYYQSAKDWILNLVKLYLIEGEANANINIPEEQARLEKWRQELTIQSQELTRIRLETETRREELQALEENLAWEKEKLKSNQNY